MLHYQSCAVCPCPCCMSMSIMHVHVHVHVACPCKYCMSMSMSMYIYIYRNAGMPDRPASGQSGTGLKKTNDAGLSCLSAFQHPCMSIARSMLHDQSRAVCPCPCCMSMSILHVRVHAPCLCQYPCTYIEMLKCRTVRHPVSPVPD